MREGQLFNAPHIPSSSYRSALLHVSATAGDGMASPVPLSFRTPTENILLSISFGAWGEVGKEFIASEYGLCLRVGLIVMSPTAAVMAGQTTSHCLALELAKL